MHHYFRDDTIAAIVTSPHSMSGVGIVRLSGTRAWEIAARLLRRPNGSEFVVDAIETHKLYRTQVINRQSQPLDDGMFVWMRGPHSFTGEDVVELHLHGNPHLLRRILGELSHFGSSPAHPGEFSFRAFRNGKLSLDQAEAVGDLIASHTEEGTDRALALLLGQAKDKIGGLKSELVSLLAAVEVEIDFSDQGLSTLDYSQWKERLLRWNAQVQAVRDDFERSKPRREGIRLALVGAPNSGKSSLFNRLLGEDRSIVSDEAGTTRDIVRESIEWRGLLFRVSDTAGIRDTENRIEAEGVDRSLGEIGSADAVLWVFDGVVENESRKDWENRWELLRSRGPKNALVVAAWNKADCASEPPAQWSAFFRSLNIPMVVVSAKTGQGLDELAELFCTSFSASETAQPDFRITRNRHFELLGKAQNAVIAATEKVSAGEILPDLLSTDLREALSHLGELTGEFTTEDLLGHIFSEFCIGK